MQNMYVTVGPWMETEMTIAFLPAITSCSSLSPTGDRHPARAAGDRTASSFLRVLAVIAALGSAMQLTFAADASTVGQVSLLIGEARVVRADGSQERLQRGSRIHVGDRVETSANGHVHMRFVDNAAISVRPESILEVQAYRYDAQSPQSSEIRLRVEKGTSRSISGAATDVDKSRFRLNTPIAAIGVRGTDFIVQTDPEGVRATVSDGAIVVGALGGACSPVDLGPCAGTAVRELSAEMGKLMAEVRVGDRSTRIVPAVDLPMAAAATNGRDAGSERQLSMSDARATGLSAAQPTPPELQRGNDRAAAGLLTLATVNVPDLNRPSDVAAQLVWGRWAILPEANDKLSVPFALARLGRHVTVADEEAGLFRADQGAAAVLSDTLQAKVEFRLARASATYEVGAVIESAAVLSSNLTVDFSNRTFATGLVLSSASGGTSTFAMAGAVRNDGLFAVKDVDQRVAGAISLSGKEAGYLFERNTVEGLFRGRTLWGQ